MERLPVDTVRGLFSLQELEALLGVSRIQVWRWGQPKPAGHAGLVPSRHHEALLAEAKRLGRPLSLRDLLPWLDETTAA